MAHAVREHHAAISRAGPLHGRPHAYRCARTDDRPQATQAAADTALHGGRQHASHDPAAGGIVSSIRWPCRLLMPTLLVTGSIAASASGCSDAPPIRPAEVDHPTPDGAVDEPDDQDEAPASDAGSDAGEAD